MILDVLFGVFDEAVTRLVPRRVRRGACLLALSAVVGLVAYGLLAR